MDVMNVQVQTTAPAADAASAASAPAQTQAQQDFAKLLGKLQAQTQSETPAQSTENGAPATSENIVVPGAVRLLMGEVQTGVDPTLQALVEQLQDLLQQDPDTMEESQLDALQKLLASLQKRMEQIVGEQGVPALTGQLNTLLPQLQLPEVLSTAQNAGQPLPQVGEAAQSAQPEALLELLTGDSQTLLQALQAQGQTAPATDFGTTMEQAAAQPQTLEVPVQEIRHEHFEAPSDVQQRNEFESAVRAVKQQTEAQPQTAQPEQAQEAKAAEGKTTAKTLPDVDTLQQQVDTGVHFAGTAFSQSVAAAAEPLPTEAPSVATQVEEGVLAGIKEGGEEFTIKLLPEGLGEMTVKLTRVGEEMLLKIVTKSAETQRLLSEELNGLRESLRSYKVQVDSVLTEREEQLLNQQQHFEQQRQNHQAQQSGQTGRYRGGNGQNTEEAEAVQLAAETASAPKSALDAYI